MSSIDEQAVDINGQIVTMTSLVPSDVEKCRKLILGKKLDEGLAMEYLTFLGMKKKHPEVTWFKFQRFNFRTINKLMAVMAVMNGFNDTFQVFGGYGDSEFVTDGDSGELDFE